MCSCFDENKAFRNMSFIPREVIIDYANRIPGRPDRYYGGIAVLSYKKMLGFGVNPLYFVRACLDSNILIVAIESGGKKITQTKIMGVVAVNIHNSNTMEIDVIGTRSHHTSVGTHLLDVLFDAARDCEFNICFLKSVPNAMRFYLKSNFTYLGTTKYDPIFVIDLNADVNLQLKPTLHRQNSGNEILMERVKVVDVENEMITDEDKATGFGIRRNLDLKKIIETWKKLKTNQPWEWLHSHRQLSTFGVGYYAKSKHHITERFSYGKSPKADNKPASATFKTIQTRLNNGLGSRTRRSP
jgi:hypothetical protein